MNDDITKRVAATYTKMISENSNVDSDDVLIALMKLFNGKKIEFYKRHRENGWVDQGGKSGVTVDDIVKIAKKLKLKMTKKSLRPDFAGLYNITFEIPSAAYTSSYLSISSKDNKTLFNVTIRTVTHND